jgi:hypothetical protein
MKEFVSASKISLASVNWVDVGDVQAYEKALNDHFHDREIVPHPWVAAFPPRMRNEKSSRERN